VDGSIVVHCWSDKQEGRARSHEHTVVAYSAHCTDQLRHGLLSHIGPSKRLPVPSIRNIIKVLSPGLFWVGRKASRMCDFIVQTRLAFGLAPLMDTELFQKVIGPRIGNVATLVVVFAGQECIQRVATEATEGTTKGSLGDTLSLQKVFDLYILNKNNRKYYLKNRIEC
jgi:hypothetical protein